MVREQVVIAPVEHPLLSFGRMIPRDEICREVTVRMACTSALHCKGPGLHSWKGACVQDGSVV